MAPIKRMAKRLKELRKKRGFTQEELATRAGVSRVYIAKLETAKQEPTLGIIEKLAKALGVKVGALVE